jgi:hypothetical protein
MMKETTRQTRTTRLQGALQATIKHVENALSALNDANIYSNDEQEFAIDTLVTRLEDILHDLHTEVPEC